MVRYYFSSSTYLQRLRVMIIFITGRNGSPQILLIKMKIGVLEGNLVIQIQDFRKYVPVERK